MSQLLIQSPAFCRKCNIQIVSTTNTLIDGKCFQCGGVLTSFGDAMQDANTAEVAMLREQRDALVAREQFVRNELNSVRRELNSVRDQLKKAKDELQREIDWRAFQAL